MLAFLWGKLSIEYAAGRYDGDLRTVSPDMIEQYAHWRGEKGAFASWVLTRHCDPDTGKIREWDTYMGALTRQRSANRQRVSDWREKNRERDNENQRKRREKERIRSTQSEVTITSTAASVEVTNYVAPLSTTNLNKLLSEIVNDNRLKDKSLKASTNGTYSSSVTSELLRSALERYFATFYADASDERVEEVAWQLHATRHSDKGAFVARNEPRAYSTDRTLYQALIDTIAEGVKDKDKAIVVTLKKLQSGKANLEVDEHGETVTERVSRETLAVNSSPLEDARAAELVARVAKSVAMPDPKRVNGARPRDAFAESMRSMLDDIEYGRITQAPETASRSHDVDAQRDEACDVESDVD